MGVCALGLHHKIQTTKAPFVMERAETHNESGHVIDITSNSEPSSSSATQDRPVNGSNSQQNEDLPTTSVSDPVFQRAFSTVNGTNARSAPFARRGDGPGRRRSPLNSGYWISIELVITASQIIAAIIVLSLSRHEHPCASLFTWVIGYASGCVATLPPLFWRFHYRNQDPSQPHQGFSTPSSLSAIATSFTSSSNARTSVGDTHNIVGSTTPITVLLRARLVSPEEIYKAKGCDECVIGYTR